jgi:hypothetical protein
VIPGGMMPPSLAGWKPAATGALAGWCLETPKPATKQAIRLLVGQGFREFTNYMLFNFKDTPRELYDRLWVNASLNKELSVRITGFPMRFIPMDDVSRRHVAPGLKWCYLRGIHCILLATRGLVSPNPDFICDLNGNPQPKLTLTAGPGAPAASRESHRTRRC